MNQDDIWQRRSHQFWPGTTYQNSKELPPGLYQYNITSAGWFLELTAPNFKFPYKIYGSHDSIVSRIKTAWAAEQGNLGVLLNGIKGTGKTVVGQLLANWAISEGMPVIVVTYAIPLADILGKVQQPVMVIFDEFEKTHAKREEQQALLTALDGMARSVYKRLYVFTTNSRAVDENFIDRPSRIRYCWEFDRIADDVLEHILDDLLRPDLRHLRNMILTYLHTRKVLSIDIVKTVINEVNVFSEPPSAFEALLNLTELDASNFLIEQLNELREPVRSLTSNFRLRKADSIRLHKMLSKSGQDWFTENYEQFDCSLTFDAPFNGFALKIRDRTDLPNDWVCHVRINSCDTWLGRYPKVMQVARDGFWLDAQPMDWRVPDWAKKIQAGTTLTEAEEHEKETWEETGTVYGGEAINALVRITPEYTPQVFQFHPA